MRRLDGALGATRLPASERKRWATFDCYGTLIDWNGGIGRELERLFGPRAAASSCTRTTSSSRRSSARIRVASYREVMAVALARLGAPAGEQDALGRSLPEWDPFPEVPAALEEARARGWRLAVLSNTDRDLLDASLARIGVEFERDRRRVRDRLVQARAGPLGRVLRAQRSRPRRATSTSPPASSTTSRRRRRSACGRSGSTGSARRPSPSPTSSCGAWPAWPTASTRSCRRERPPDHARRLPGARRLSRRGRDASLRPAVSGRRAGRHGLALGPGPRSTTRGCSRTEAGSSRSAGSRSTTTRASRSASSIAQRRGRGLGSTLVDRSEERLRELGAARIHNVTLAPDAAAQTLLARPRLPRGAPLLGDGDRARRRAAARSVLPEVSDRAVLRRSSRARSTPRSRRRSPTTGSTSRSRSRSGGNGRSRSRTYDPSLWFLLRDGEDVAAATPQRAASDPAAAGSARSACVAAWRGRGLREGAPAAQLRASSIGAGKRASTLGVDAENPTGATQLYESVGMVVETRARRLGEGCSRERPPVRRRRRAGRRGAHLRGRGALLRPPRPPHRRGHPHVPALEQGGVGLGGGRPDRRERDRSACTATRRTSAASSATRGAASERRSSSAARRSRERRARRRSSPAPPSRTPRRVRSSSRAAIARCGASTRWRSS